MTESTEHAATGTAGRLWGGRFAVGPSAELMALSRFEAEHLQMLPYDVAGSIAHAHALNSAGILSNAEAQTLVDALEGIREEYLAGTLTASSSDEDVHGFVERVLIERLGPGGGKIRAGRSRNDQVANDVRLFLRDAARPLHARLLALIDALATQAEKHRTTIVPGFTHLQPAQPVVFGHQLLAHAQAMLRDLQRIRQWDARTALCPLGAAALAGSAIVKDLAGSARDLGYEAVCANSMDAVSARDHVSEFLFIAANIGVTVSRLAEEVTLWTSAQFGWARLHDSYSTGSSIMPQKKNPDIAELSRGKAARLVGSLDVVLNAVKGLPLTYNRDLSEDKHAAIDAVATLRLVLPAMTGMVATLHFDEKVMRRDASGRFTLATEVADYLAVRGVPFSEAHEIAGRVVRRCEDLDCDLPDLTSEEYDRIDARLADDLMAELTAEAAVAKRDVPGGTAVNRVGEQLTALREACDAVRGWSESYTGPRFAS